MLESGMGELVLTTYDWVPAPPRGLVRDLRIRWALEEAALPYRVATTPFESRGEAHLAHQPFGQIPWLTDGDLSLFESGAILVHLGELSEALLPAERRARTEALNWVFAALNSVEAFSQPWVLLAFSPETRSGPDWERWGGLMNGRLQRLEPVLAAREWLAGPFSIADILVGDVLRAVDRFGGLAAHPACRAYVGRATARPAFAKAHADQMAHFAAADQSRSAQA
jgi:glutathione S-transferase